MGSCICRTELRTVRLRWWQNIAKEPERHEQILAAMFGEISAIDDKGKLVKSTVLSDTHPFAMVESANRWAKQYWQDVESLESVGEFSDFLEDVGESPLSPFLIEHVREQFVQIDVTILRQVELKKKGSFHQDAPT